MWILENIKLHMWLALYFIEQHCFSLSVKGQYLPHRGVVKFE